MSHYCNDSLLMSNTVFSICFGCLKPSWVCLVLGLILTLTMNHDVKVNTAKPNWPGFPGMSRSGARYLEYWSATVCTTSSTAWQWGWRGVSTGAPESAQQSRWQCTNCPTKLATLLFTRNSDSVANKQLDWICLLLWLVMPEYSRELLCLLIKVWFISGFSFPVFSFPVSHFRLLSNLRNNKLVIGSGGWIVYLYFPCRCRSGNETF